MSEDRWAELEVIQGARGGQERVAQRDRQADPAALALVGAAWQACGAKLFTLDAATHDRVFATVSHLPHLLAFALVEQVAMQPDAEQLFSFAAGGFRDAVRLDVSLPDQPASLLLTWPKGARADAGACLKFLEGLTP